MTSALAGLSLAFLLAAPASAAGWSFDGASAPGAGTAMEFPVFAAAERRDPQVRKWERAGFKNPVISTFTVPEASTAAATHGFDLTIVLFRGSGWTFAEAEPHFKRINEIYAQCGIRLSGVALVESDPYRGILDVETSWVGEDLTLAKALPDGAVRPVMFLLRGLPSQMSAYAAIPSYALHPLDPAIHNAIFVSDYVNDSEWPYYRDMDESGMTYRLLVDPSYDVFAHELAHLFADDGHELPGKNGRPKDEKNLLAGDKSEVDGTLLPRQCEAFKKSPLLRPL